MFKVVIVGNCQGNEVMQKLKRALRDHDGFSFTAIRSYLNFSAADKAAIAGADLLLEQIGAFENPSVTLASEGVKQRLKFPALSSSFLWPLGSQAHPKNNTDGLWNAGPFPMQAGNPWLNERIVRGDDPQTIVDEYEALNVASLRSLDRAFKIDAFKWGQLEKASGLNFAEDMGALAKTTRAFHAPLHPSIAIIDLIVASILEQAPFKGLKTAEWRGGGESFFRIQIPVHPSIIDHFGFEWASSARFNLWESGPLTHKEWVSRYVHFNPNTDLRRLITKVRTEKKYAASLQDLWSMQEHEPQSADLQVALALAYLELKNPKSALPYAQKAVELWPNETESLFTLIKTLFQLGDYNQAAELCRRLSAIEPYHIGSVMVLNRIARQVKNLELAKETSDRLHVLQPNNERVIETVAATETLIKRQKLKAAKEAAIPAPVPEAVMPVKSGGLPKRVKSKGKSKKKS